MGYLYLLAAIIGSSSLVILLKVFEFKNVNINLGVTINYIVGAILSFALVPELSLAGIVGSGWFATALVTGFTFMAALAIYGISAQRSGVAITTISGRAAVVIPVIVAFVLYGEQPTLLKISMLALILFAMVLILRKEKTPGSDNAKVAAWAYLLPVAVFIGNGLSDTFIQYASRERLPAGDMNMYFTFVGTMFLAGAATGLLFFIIECVRRKKAYIPRGWDFGLGGILGVMNFICTVGMFISLSYFEGSVFYPLYYTGAIILSTIVGVWVFHERLSKLNWAGIAVAVAAIAILSMA